MAETKFLLTEGYGSGSVYLFRVESETAKTFKAVEWHNAATGWGNRVNTILKEKVLATYDIEENARLAIGRAKHAWDKAGGPVGDARRRLREREIEQRAAWIAALSPDSQEATHVER